MPKTKSILLLGAGGTLGGYIKPLLQDALPTAQIISASRTENPAIGLAHRRLDIHDTTTYAAALKNIDVVIHAAGPFNHDPTALVTACLSNSIHFIDIAEDLSFIKKVNQTAAAFKHPTACAVSGCSTLPAMVSLFSQRFADMPALASLKVYLNMGSANPVTYGLMNGLLQPLGRVLPNGKKCFRKLGSRTHHDGVKKHYGNYPAPFSDGIKIGTRKVPLTFHAGFDRSYINIGLAVASFVLPYLSAQHLNRISRLLLWPASLAQKIGATEGRLVIEANDAQGNAIAETEIIAKKDGLKLPSAPSVWAAKALLSNQVAHLSGAIELADLISASAAIEWIQRYGYEAHVREP